MYPFFYFETYFRISRYRFGTIFPVVQFNELNNYDKKASVEKLHARWTHPDSEVRNRIKLFAVCSPDILKPILESR
jgi:hypothetical protein